MGHRQLVELGLGPGAIGRRLEDGRLHRLHKGVYAVGHPAIGRHGRLMAALLATGPGSLLSHGSAAWVWGLLPRLQRSTDVTVTGGGRRHDGITVHRSRTLLSADRAESERLPLTSVPRTLLDLAATGSPARTESAIDRAERLGVLDIASIDALLRRSRGARGVARLAAAIEPYRVSSFTRSVLERRFLDLVLRSGLPRPAMNCFVAGMEVDAYWEAERFVVELDGFETHRTRLSFERDRVRQEALSLAGIESIRVTSRRVEQEPRRVAANLRTLLARRRPA